MTEASITGLVVGIVLALAVAAVAKVVGLDRDRAFYPTVLIVVASYYVLFAVMGGSPKALLLDTAGFVLFAGAALVGFRFNRWIVVGGLALHGLIDIGHMHVVANPGVPVWWPSFCSAYDLTAAAWLAWRFTTAGALAEAKAG
jgi:hypothetical protein